MRFLTSTPLVPIAERARELSASCAALDVVTAFVTPDAVADVVEPAASAGARVRFLTGTFGSATRLSTFKAIDALARSSSAMEARVWRCRDHGRLHAKMMVWRSGEGSAVVWIGSANLTTNGYQDEGELVAEIEIAADDAALAAVDEAFAREWKRGAPLDKDFLASYREAPRTPFFDVYKRARGQRRPRAPSAPREGQRMFVVTANTHVAEGGKVHRRVAQLLGNAVQYYVHRSKLLEEVKTGDWSLYIDQVDRDIAVVEVTDVTRDEDGIAFAYELLDEERGWAPLRKKTIAALRDLGLRSTTKGLRAQWVEPELVAKVQEIVHPPTRENRRT